MNVSLKHKVMNYRFITSSIYVVTYVAAGKKREHKTAAPWWIILGALEQFGQIQCLTIRKIS